MRYFFLLFPSLSTLFSAQVIPEELVTQELNFPALFFFGLFVMLALAITLWAKSKTQSTLDFYSAGAKISSFKNGLALTGDYISVAFFLAVSGAIYLKGFDGLIYAVGFLVGWPVMLFLIAEPVRNLGRFTFADVSAYRLRQRPVRILTSLGTLATIALYLTALMVGSGKLIELLFGLDYTWALAIVGLLMIFYVSFGGMLATTWIQIIQASLLLIGATLMCILVLSTVDFNFERFFAQAIEKHPDGETIMVAGGLISDSYSAISLGLALILGTVGLPHVLMRIFTVQSARQARESVFYATGFIGYFYILSFIIGFGAIVLVYNNPQYLDFAKQALEGGQPILGGKNMAAIHLSHALGGDLFLGFIAAISFSTLLALLAGITLAGASSLSHDLYACVFASKPNEKRELFVSRAAALLLGLLAITLGILFKEVNISYMVGLAFAIAASANFPLLFLSLKWSGLTTRGATLGGSLGLLTALALVILGPTVWVDILGNSQAIFPSKYPALISVSVAFSSIIIISLLDRSEGAKKERLAFEAQYLRAVTGIGYEGNFKT